MDEIWDLEERFWLAGIGHFQAEMHSDCIMAVPAPVGILAGASIAASLEGAPRWSSVDIGERHVLRPMPDAVVVASMHGQLRAQGGWRPVQHQHSPA